MVWLANFWQDALPFDRLNRHNLPTFYARNGPAVLVTRASIVLESNSFYGQRFAPYEMREEESFDIDTPFDLRLVEWLLEQQMASKVKNVSNLAAPAVTHNNLRIAHISPTRGGVANVARRLHQGLLKLGVDSKLFLSEGQVQPETQTYAVPPRIDALPYRQGFQAGEQTSWCARNASRLVAVLVIPGCRHHPSAWCRYRVV